MTTSLSKGVPVWIIALIAIAGTGLLVGPSIIFIYFIRKRRQRLRGITSIATGERRLSHINRGRLTITDDDFARLPQVRAVLRKSTRNPYAREWIPAAARDGLIRRSIISMPPMQGYNDPRCTSSVPPWSISQSSVRSNAVPLHRMKSLPPIKETSTNDTNNHTRNFSMEKLPATDQAANSTGASPIGSSPPVSPIELTRPQLPFGTQQRSYSSGAIAGNTHRGYNQFSSKEEPGEFNDSEPHNNVATRAARQRSMSLHSQASGHAPHKRLPSPPPSIPRWSTVQTLRDDLGDTFMSTSLGSSASIDSCILNDEDNDFFSAGYADLASTSTFSPFPLEDGGRSPLSCAGERNSWNWSKIGCSVASSNHSLTSTIQPQRGSHDAPESRPQLLRRGSSELSISVVERHTPFRDESLVLNNDMKHGESPMSFHDWNLDAQEQERHVTGKGTPSSSEWLLNSYGHFILALESRTPKSKRASTSVLQDISGNEASPSNSKRKKRSSSIATSQPFTWDMAVLPHSGRASVSKDWSEGHKRSSLVRIAFAAPVTTSPRSATTVKRLYEVQGCSSKISSIPGLFVTQSAEDTMSPRPPSRPTFDPQINWSPHRTNDLKLDDRYYSATMSLYNLHSDLRNAQSCPIPSTPTRKPSRRWQNHLPCSGREIPSNLNNPEWPLLTSPLSPSKKGGKIATSSDNPEQTLDVTTVPPSDTQTPSFLFPFPQPPKPKGRQRPPVHAIKGSRTTPARLTSPKKGSPKRSSPLRNFARPFPQDQPSGLMAHAVALRRMNSETSALDVGERKKFLMDGDNSISEEEGSKERDMREDHSELDESFWKE